MIFGAAIWYIKIGCIKNYNISKHIVMGLKNKNIGVSITDHNVHETLSITNRAYLLIEGAVFCHGTPQELAANEQVREKYLGDSFELR